MSLRRAFASSRVGWRVFGLFVLAAALPIALIAVLTDRAVESSWRDSQAIVGNNTAKAAALQALDRLHLAQHTLEFLVATTDTSVQMGDHAADHLSAAVELRADGTRRVVHGGAKAAALLDQPLPADAGQVPDQLFLTHAPDGTAGITLLHRDEVSGRRLLGLVDPTFLWEDSDALPTGMWLCAIGPAGETLFCSDARLADTARSAARRPGASHGDALPPAVKELFLGAHFAAPGWHFVAGTRARDGGPLVALASSVVPTAALASLLFVTLLSMVQIRRTMRPLARLADGARQMAQRRFGVRVDVTSRDEFGQLAEAFNDMATKLEAQFDELGTLAAIDRQIVEQRGIDAAFDTIARRVAQLLPGRCVAVGRLRTPDGGAAHVQRAGPVAGPHATVLDAAQLAALQQTQAWAGPAAAALAQAFGWPPLAGLHALPLTWRERCLGFIAIAQPDGSTIDDDTMRQLIELRDRAAVAANAAEREDRLVHEARHDILTGLLNRTGLQERLAELLARPGDAAVAVLVIDLDRFKLVNDQLGHAAGDQALRIVAARLQRCAGERSVVARRAGDEFVVLLPDPASPAAAAQVAQAMCTSMASAVTIDDQPFSLGASIGITLASGAQVPVQEALRQADHAMYEAKRRGGGRVGFFDPRLDEQAHRRAWIERDLSLAAARGELFLAYQPRVDAHSGAVNSVEALVRWQHPVHGLVSPGDFIPVAEESELIEHIGAWVIETACAQLAAWRRAGIDSLRVAVNLSARQLDSVRLESDLLGAIGRHGVPPSQLELEITESVFVDHAPATIGRLEALRHLGMTIALDDFGTGYSSMSYLRRLPIDVVKIDRAFVQDLGTERSALAVAQAIVTLAGALDMGIVAEGVETPAQREVLRSLGCGELQGFLISRPLRPEALEAWLAQRGEAPEAAVAEAV